MSLFFVRRAGDFAGREEQGRRPACGLSSVREEQQGRWGAGAVGAAEEMGGGEPVRRLKTSAFRSLPLCRVGWLLNFTK